jgi:ribosomal protein S18 acetylase RimI-like enzyme
VEVDLVTTATDADAEELWPVYAEVFEETRDLAGWRAGTWDRHVARAGFRLARVRQDGELMGFAYGLTGEHGQWWTDRVTAVWPDELVATWLGGHFELVSVGVREEARGRGAGGLLLDAVTAGLPHDRWLLMTTADAADPARRLYASRGWDLVGPGLSEMKVILGRLS